MNPVYSFTGDFVFTSIQQRNLIKQGKYPNGIQIFTFLRKQINSLMGRILDFKRNMTDGNLIKKCVEGYNEGLFLLKSYVVLDYNSE